MKQFKFRLEALLKVREHTEREKQKKHARAVQMVQKQREALKALDADRVQTANNQRTHMTGRISVAELLVYSRYLQKVKGEHVMGQELLGGLDREAESKREDLVEASKQKKIYEQLKERLRDRHYKKLNTAINKENDEIAISSHRQKMK